LDETSNGADCIATGALSKKERGSASKAQVCRREYGGVRDPKPYNCRSSPGYACCQGNAGHSVTLPDGAKCTISPPGDDEDVEVEEELLEIIE